MNLAAPYPGSDGRLHVDYSYQHFAALNGISEDEHIAKHLAQWRVWMAQTSAAVHQALMNDYHEEGGGKNAAWLEDE